MLILARLLWRWALLLSGLFLLPVLLIRAQPYDDGGLREILPPPEGCPAPCFMGLRPGAMDVQTAAAILDKHPWVQRTESPLIYRTTFQLSWLWSAQVPAWLDPQFFAFVVLDDEQLTMLYLRTKLSRAELLLALGRPDQYRLEITPNMGYEYEAWYSALDLYVLAVGDCEDIRATYAWPVVLFFQPEPPELPPAAPPPVTFCR